VSRRAGRPQTRISDSSGAGCPLCGSLGHLLVPLRASPLLFAFRRCDPGILRSGYCGFWPENASLLHRNIDADGRCSSSFSLALARRIRIDVLDTEQSAGADENSRYWPKRDHLINQSCHRRRVRGSRDFRKPSSVPFLVAPGQRGSLTSNRLSVWRVRFRPPFRAMMADYAALKRPPDRAVAGSPDGAALFAAPSGAILSMTALLSPDKATEDVRFIRATDPPPRHIARR
jgi:hypothetical protein